MDQISLDYKLKKKRKSETLKSDQGVKNIKQKNMCRL